MEQKAGWRRAALSNDRLRSRSSDESDTRQARQSDGASPSLRLRASHSRANWGKARFCYARRFARPLPPIEVQIAMGLVVHGFDAIVRVASKLLARQPSRASLL